MPRVRSIKSTSNDESWWRAAARKGIASPARKVRDFAWVHPTLFEMLWALLISAPPALVTNYYTITGFAESLRQHLPSLANTLDANVAYALVAGYFWALLLVWIRSFAGAIAREEPPGWEQGFSLMVKEFDEVVGRKERRFSAKVSGLRNCSQKDGCDPGSVFGEITQPRAQLDRLTQGVWRLFHTLLTTNTRGRGPDLRADVFVVKNGKVTASMCHFPSNRGVGTPSAVLSRKNSGVMSAVRSGKIVVVESTADEMQKVNPRYVAGYGSERDTDGSLICYPVTLVDTDVVMVISLLYGKPRMFLNKYEQAYKDILESFALRMRLEYSLLALKGLSGIEREGGV